MKYIRICNTVVVRIDRCEELLEQLKYVCIKENIHLATVNAIGAVGSFTLGAYHVEDKRYVKQTYEGAYEIVSLQGNISTMNGEYYAHIHMAASDDTGNTVGGHLNSAVISATCELFITVLDGCADRFYDDVTGLNLLKL
jgi:predicted DNA-binding protein with PD1-like motif